MKALFSNAYMAGKQGTVKGNGRAIQRRKIMQGFIIASESVIRQYKEKKLTEIKFPFGDVIMIILKQSLFVLHIGKLLPKYDLFGDRKRLQCNSLKGF